MKRNEVLIAILIAVVVVIIFIGASDLIEGIKNIFSASVGLSSEFCSDSDNGKKYNQKGVINSEGVLEEDNCMFWERFEGGVNGDYVEIDSCSGNYCVLNERYCSSDGIRKELYKCPNGCSDGKCN